MSLPVLALATPATSFAEQHINMVESPVTSEPKKLEALTEAVQIATTELKAKPQTSPPVSAPSSDIQEIVRAAARKYGVDENHLARIAQCESGFNPNSVNRNYYENGHPSGLFQHIEGYWHGRAAKYGHPGASVFDPVANAEVTAQMFRDGASNLWECK